jgi:ketosteroid isomerase-like protein
MSTTNEQVRELGRRWAEAEQRGDTAVLDALTTEDFTLVGPLGFMLDKQQWLDRYRSGDLVTRSVAWEDVDVRDYGAAAVAIGRITQQAEYQGRSADGRFRATHIAVRRDDRWLLAGLHYSPLGGPPQPSPQEQLPKEVAR